MKTPKPQLPKPQKPHIRMRKVKPVASSAFPTAPVAFPTPASVPGADAAMGPGAPMPGAAGLGDTGS